MPGITRIRTIAAALLLLAVIGATTGASIHGNGEQEETTIPTISIAATDGTSSVMEGESISFTITVDPAQTDDLELNVVIRAKGKFTDIPERARPIYLRQP